MKAHWISLLLGVATSLPAQTTIPFQRDPSGLRPAPANPDPAVALYQGPFYPVENEAAVYRTRMATLTELQTTPEFLDPEAILTGFDCTATGGNLGSISSIQPVYLVHGQRKAGNIIGAKGGGSTLIAARDGYAVAKLEVWIRPALSRGASSFIPGGAGDGEIPLVAGLRATFAKIEPGGTLSATDEYTGTVVGEQMGRMLVLDTMRLPACGTCAAYTAKPSAISLLVSANMVARVRPAMVPAALAQRGPVAMQPGMAPASQPGFPATVPGEAPGFPPVAGVVPPAFDPRMNELNTRVGASFAFVQGEGGAGSAFVCMMQGKRMLFTNQHVIRENPALKFTLLNQTQVKLGAARAAVGHDLMVFDIADPLPALEADIDFAANVQVGDEVLVVGNTEGQGVIKPLPGQVVGIGPNLVEISSQFMPGNSGSPILHVKSGRVIGIATYAIIRSVDSLTGARNPSVRRFGFRLDSVQQWQPVNWQLYQAEAAATTKVSQFSTALVALLRDLKSGQFLPSKHTDTRLKPAMSFLQPLMAGGNKNKADIARAMQNFMGELKNVSLRDVEALKPQLRYDFFQRELGEEIKFRTELSKALGDAVNARR